MIVKTYYNIILTEKEMNYLLEVMKTYDAVIDYSYKNKYYKINAEKEEFIELYKALRSAYRDTEDNSERTKIIRELYYEIRLIVEGW